VLAIACTRAAPAAHAVNYAVGAVTARVNRRLKARLGVVYEEVFTVSMGAIKRSVLELSRRLAHRQSVRASAAGSLGSSPASNGSSRRR
jgi:hypothetical protein